MDSAGSLLARTPGLAPTEAFGDAAPSLAPRAIGLHCACRSRAPALGQTFTWNNTGTDWATSTNWTPNGPPAGEGTLALFNATGTYGTGPINQPTWGSNPAFYASLSLNPTAQFTGWTFAESGTLSQLQYPRDRTGHAHL